MKYRLRDVQFVYPQACSCPLYSVTSRLYCITLRSRVILEEPVVTQLVEKYPAFYGIRRFITVFTRACQVRGPA